jgi:cellobiose-specific phosphotransferase system component IIC
MEGGVQKLLKELSQGEIVPFPLIIAGTLALLLGVVFIRHRRAIQIHPDDEMIRKRYRLDMKASEEEAVKIE